MKNLQNLKGAQLLSKKEQHAINGGADGCQVFWRDSSGNAIGWSEQTTYAIASSSMGYTDGSGNYVSGWCCASCPGIQ